MLENNNLKHPITGASLLNKEQMASFVLKTNPNPLINTSIHELAELFLITGEKEGIRGDIAFAQSIKETGYFTFTGDVVPEQNNYSGIGTVGGGVKGAFFNTPEEGVRAQIQHLKAYANKDELKTELNDPRFHLVTRGVSPHWEDLNGRWAVPGDGYGQSIIRLYNQVAKQ